MNDVQCLFRAFDFHRTLVSGLSALTQGANICMQYYRQKETVFGTIIFVSVHYRVVVVSPDLKPFRGNVTIKISVCIQQRNEQSIHRYT